MREYYDAKDAETDTNGASLISCILRECEHIYMRQCSWKFVMDHRKILYLILVSQWAKY